MPVSYSIVLNKISRLKEKALLGTFNKGKAPSPKVFFEHREIWQSPIVPLTVLIFPPQNRQWGGDRVLPPSYVAIAAVSLAVLQTI